MAGETTAPTLRGPYRKGIARREQIVKTAAQVFGELGYVGGSLRAIAERVGASPATLIQYFGSKEGLLAAVLEDWTVRSGLSALPDGVRGVAYFRQMRDLMEFHVQNRGLLELFITLAAEATNPSHPARDFIRRRYDHGLQLWAGKLREAVDDGEIAVLTDQQIEAEVRVLIAALDGIELQWLLGADIDLPALVATHVEQAITRWQA
ncbi:TetR/AcrR family transcriptional regulator [Kribbella sp. NPDC049584]|uniref:TetR/AcrR family transcriptional regulator n=1 Tax=Kribbella sp. NPDC049584 TaxID=3154833 RepID=UPI00343ACF6F